jgi:Skp family chaperone for outer membrane proteins
MRVDTLHFVSQVIAEIEMRKESELGGIDKDGHVITYEMKDMREEDEELEKDTASQEGIKDEDFEETKVKVKELRRLLNEIQSMQQKERRRLAVHAETNEHSHSRMVLSSLLETLLFMAVTGYQVFTIRRWFSGAPALGR